MLSFAYTKSRFTLFRLSYAPSDKRASVSSADSLLFCLFSKKTPKTLTRPWAGVHNYSYTVPVSPLPAPGRSAPGVFLRCGFRQNRRPGFHFSCRRTAPRLSVLSRQIAEGSRVLVFPFRRYPQKTASGSSGVPSPVLRAIAARPPGFCNMHPVFLQNRTDKF